MFSGLQDAAIRVIDLNEEFEELAWVRPEDLSAYDLNEANRTAFAHKSFR